MVPVAYILSILLSVFSVVLCYLTTGTQQWLRQPLNSTSGRGIAILLLIVSATFLIKPMGLFPAVCTPFLIWMLGGLLIPSFTAFIKKILKR